VIAPKPIHPFDVQDIIHMGAYTMILSHPDGTLTIDWVLYVQDVNAAITRPGALAMWQQTKWGPS
jgi:hypothetical protein